MRAHGEPPSDVTPSNATTGPSPTAPVDRCPMDMAVMSLRSSKREGQKLSQRGRRMRGPERATPHTQMRTAAQRARTCIISRHTHTDVFRAHATGAWTGRATHTDARDRETAGNRAHPHTHAAWPPALTALSRTPHTEDTLRAARAPPDGVRPRPPAPPRGA